MRTRCGRTRRLPPAVLTGIAAGTIALLASARPARADKVDDLVRAEMQQRRMPGVSVAVVRGGKQLLARGYGSADLERRVPATADTVYEIGSVTKQFTATAIMMLVEGGKLHLDNRTGSLLPDVPAAWRDVTLRELLTHTSGIPNYTSVPDALKKMRDDYTQEQILALVSDRPLEFTPGEKWSYSNTNYFLLGMILEKASGKHYGEFLQERIFRPLGMTATRVNDARDIIPNRACGYTLEGSTLRNAPWASMTWPFAAGVLVSTVKDLARWDAALTAGRLLKADSLREMWTPAQLKGGKRADYGFGWGVATYQGHRLVSHSGGIPGYVCNISRFPDDRLTVIVLTNTDRADPEGLAKKIAGLYVTALAPVSPKAIRDEDPAATQRLRQLLADLAAGHPDTAAFTPEARAALFPDRVKEAEELFKQLGPLKSLEPLEQKREGERRHYHYRGVFGNTPLSIQVVLTGDGKAAELGIRPE